MPTTAKTVGSGYTQKHRKTWVYLSNHIYFKIPLLNYAFYRCTPHEKT